VVAILDDRIVHREKQGAELEVGDYVAIAEGVALAGNWWWVLRRKAERESTPEHPYLLDFERSLTTNKITIRSTAKPTQIR
jgi:hypothetical protein